ncbi:MAG TPA: TIGR04283 family arsenosugar biosynthesis glycosyltransferase [Candidatus Cybelea sp.]|nr:TIGR04283 family arsenosugar biosynthesis glycosyltransferase [Candidatus Cybelea sp.]
MTSLSIIIPTLDEAAGIVFTLERVQPLRTQGHEVIVADGGSRDGTPDLARPLADRVLSAPRGRAAQMNAGARIACGDVLLFLHADTLLPRNAARLIAEGMVASGRDWGRFDVQIASRHPLLAVVTRLMNWRSRLTGIATGDQAIFVRRAVFEALGGYAPIALMEDVDLTLRLKLLSPPLCLRERVATSARRWESHGTVRTIVLMWWLRLRLFFGASPADLAKIYHRPPPEPPRH